MWNGIRDWNSFRVMYHYTLINYKGGNGALIETLGWYKLNQVIMVIIIRDRTVWHQVLSDAIHKSPVSLWCNSSQESMAWIWISRNTGWMDPNVKLLQNEKTVPSTEDEKDWIQRH